MVKSLGRYILFYRMKMEELNVRLEGTLIFPYITAMITNILNVTSLCEFTPTTVLKCY